jgi:dihydropyrimidine dehydrogenase (NAD+) subunit PreA
MAVDLSTRYGGIKIKNPIMGGSGPPSQSLDICKKADKANAAGFVLKTNLEEITERLATTIGHPHYRMADLSGLEPWRPIPPKKSDPVIRGKKGVMQPPYSLIIIPLGIPVPAFGWLDDYIDHYKEIRKGISEDCLVVPSFYAASKKGWDRHFRRIKEMNPAAVELELSCPIVAGVPGLELGDMLQGLAPGEPPCARPEVLERVVKYVVDHVDVPVIVKLNAMSFRNVEAALRCQEVGAQGIQLADSSTGLMLKIDPETATPGWHPDFPTAGGGWGRWIIQTICGQIYQMRKGGVKIDITACGGVTYAMDVVRYIMSGASSVHVCRVVMAEGWGIVTGWLEELSQWMEKKGYSNIKDMQGIVIDKVETDINKLPFERPQIMGGPRPSQEMLVSEEKCIGCRWCAEACMYCAIEVPNELAVINKDKCEACGMCEALCPVGAIKMQPVAR